MHELDEVIQHFGVKGMRWGVRRDGGKSKKGKLDNHNALKDFGKHPVKNYRKAKVKMDVYHIDAKTGEYTHQTKTAKSVRTVGKVMDVANHVLLSSIQSY